MAEPTDAMRTKATQWLCGKSNLNGDILGAHPPVDSERAAFDALLGCSLADSLASLLAEVAEEEFRPLSELAQERRFPDDWCGDEIADGMRQIVRGLEERVRLEKAEGRAEERAAVVSWLREGSYDKVDQDRYVLALRIERGEHMKAKP